jgi:UDP:flavonoid glycosyltransferase YjiC (YdhE family)
MANILYGVNGEGSGHSTRAREVISHLERQGHTIHVVSFDRGLRNLGESLSVTEIFGLRLTYVNNRVRYKRTLARNLIKAPRAARSLRQLSRLVEEKKIDLVITDFEPLTFLFPPILRREVLAAKPQNGDYALVYVTSPAKDLIALLRQVRYRFIAYGFGCEGQEGNVLFKKPGMEGFLRDLAGSGAVIANAGFSLVSEAFHLGKPYLAVPVQHQFEQTFNAYYVDKMGYGAFWEEMSKEKVESFLFNLPAYAEKLKSYPRAGNQALLAKLDDLIATLAPCRRQAADV